MSCLSEVVQAHFDPSTSIRLSRFFSYAARSLSFSHCCGAHRADASDFQSQNAATVTLLLATCNLQVATSLLQPLGVIREKTTCIASR